MIFSFYHSENCQENVQKVIDIGTKIPYNLLGYLRIFQAGWDGTQEMTSLPVTLEAEVDLELDVPLAWH